ncbi:MAG: acyl-CoA dehydrogenase C-terminal domain-containing protein [Gammaproteobacteria bacterium]|nr:acyl-CoA dehydrogenase C-terminal domain-containing protein [Gammaproteobacteria bacterium]
MPEYHGPVREMLFVIRELAGLDRVACLPGCEEATPDLVEAILEQAAQLASDVIAPTNTVGDRQGSRVENDGVIVPAEFKAAYREYQSGGWASLTAPAEYGGQGLPFLLGVAVEEMWCSANLAWSLCPLLTEGAARAIEAHASDALRKAYLPKMVAGEWTGTMNLTEPQAGSDLAALRAQAVPEGDHYRITGQKIFITWGDHDMTENVVHLVLARLPDAPPGVRGISLFLAPKFLLNADGTPGERNTVRPVSVEHKLGIHGSPTCVMAFENAVGYLVGEANNGLAAMFTMMNHARLGVGLEGVAVAERAYQQARDYARERVQGKVPGQDGRAAIIQHADVRRMLLTMKSYIEAMRSIAYVTAADLDISMRHPDPATRAKHRARVELMTPVVKGWSTEIGQVLASLGVQIHGGMGYVEETGAAQYLRDARITTIYEGTTGIQANDLVARKILRDGGASLVALLAEMRATDADLARHPALATVRKAHAEGCASVEAAGRWLAANHAKNPAVPGAVACSMLMLLGTVTGGWQLARGAVIASERLAAGAATSAAEREFLMAKLVTADFYAGQFSPLATACLRAIEAGADALVAFPDSQF